MTELQEARLLGRAIKSRWDIPEAEKRNVVESLLNLACNGAEESTRVAASRALIAAEGQNQKDQLEDVNALRRQLLQLATQFGVVGLVESGGGVATALDSADSLESDEQSNGT